jgi:hypothetical protein
MKRLRFSLALFAAALFCLPGARAVHPAMGPGETLVFRVGWTVFRHAGEIKITAEAAPPADGKEQLKVITTTATGGAARAFYRFDANADGIYDVATGRLLSITENAKSQKKETKTSVTFDYATATASYQNLMNGSPAVPLKMPAGDPQDLIMSLVQTRLWIMKPGEKRDALVFFGDEFYELTLYAERYEDVRTPMGTFKTLLIVPRMEKTPPKGMFKRGGAVSVWISQDERKLPVKFQVDFKFGAGVATLINYQPPTAEVKAKDEKSPTAEKPPAETPKSAEPDAKNPRP